MIEEKILPRAPGLVLKRHLLVKATVKLQERHPGFIIGFHRKASGKLDALSAMNFATSEKYSIPVDGGSARQALNSLQRLIEHISASQATARGVAG